MKFLVEVKYIVHEEHLQIRDDSPVIGAYEEMLDTHEAHGPYSSPGGATRKVNSLRKHYEKLGYRISPATGRLFSFDFYIGEISLRIEEKEFSRTRIR